VLFTACHSQASAQQIRVAIKDSAVVSKHSIIRIDDIADLSGGSDSDRQRMARLDLESMNAIPDHCEILRRQVVIRLLVDGFPRDQFEVEGPQSITVRSEMPANLRPRLESDLQKEISRQFALNDDRVSVRLTNETQLQSVRRRLGGATFNTKVLLSPQLPLGRTNIEVEFSMQAGDRFVERFETQVVVEMSLAIAKEPIGRGQTLRNEMFDIVTRPVVRKADFALASAVVGQVAKRDISSNEVILRGHVGKLVARTDPVIKRNDLLDVIVPLGASEIRLKNARSLSVGDVGDTITVVNTRSNRQLSAVVVDRNLARVLPITGRIRR
jgi:flagella basal body P-ring formation protein FlgA